MKRRALALAAVLSAAATALVAQAPGGPALSARPAAGGGPGALPPEAQEALLRRARDLELPTRYTPPPGDPRSHAAAGWATTTCAGVFITGLPDRIAIDEVGHPTASIEERARLGRPTIHRARREVRVAVPGLGERVARYFGSQGCIALPEGQSRLSFRPVRVASRLAPAATLPWPMGDAPGAVAQAGIDRSRLAAAVDAAFADPDARTSAFLVTWKGAIVAERYGAGITAQTPLESWSMGKSLLAALMGVLIERGVYSLDQPAPLPQWQAQNDPRRAIRIRDLLNMSSGLRANSGSDPDYQDGTADGRYADHLYLYTGAADAVGFAASRPLQWPPGRVGRYRNTDPVLVGALVRRATERRPGDHLRFAQAALFDRISIRSAVIATDPHGNFLLQGYEYMSARDWARLAGLFLDRGLWRGQRILPESFVDFVQTPAPGWEADGRPMYGGFFVLNRMGTLPVPLDAYFMSGAGGQTVLIIPSLEMVVVRIGHSVGQRAGGRSFAAALRELVKAVPAAD